MPHSYLQVSWAGKLFRATPASRSRPGDQPGRRPTLPPGGRIATLQKAQRSGGLGYHKAQSPQRSKAPTQGRVPPSACRIDRGEERFPSPSQPLFIFQRPVKGRKGGRKPVDLAQALWLTAAMTEKALKVLVFGGTGTAGRGAVRALLEAGHEVRAFVRPGREADLPAGAEAVTGTLSDVTPGFAQPVDAVVSCLASRSGTPAEAWAIDNAAHLSILDAARAHSVRQFVLLSAICVQRPLLGFQHAKLAFEEALIGAGLTWSIVRPTAFFKSLSGQVARVQAGKPFLLFGDGRLTACKPISDDDLGRFIASCLTDPQKRNRILPIGGPGPAITPLDQGRALFDILDQPPRFRHVPLRLMDGIVGGLSLAGRLSAKARAKAELARIGRYYASESMLVWDEAKQRYDAEATPETGEERLFGFYERLISGEARIDLGAHAVF